MQMLDVRAQVVFAVSRGLPVEGLGEALNAKTVAPASCNVHEQRHLLRVCRMERLPLVRQDCWSTYLQVQFLQNGKQVRPVESEEWWRYLSY